MVHPIGHGIGIEVRHEPPMVERFPREIGKAARRFTGGVSEMTAPDGKDHVPRRCFTLELFWSTQSTTPGLSMAEPLSDNR